MRYCRNMLVLALCVFIIAGCTTFERQKIEVEKTNAEGIYEDFKEITSSKNVKKVKKTLHNADWEQVKVDMKRPPDYQFIFQFIDPKIQAKAIPYSVWTSPNNNTLELVQGDQLYVHLNEKDASILFKILTDSSLADVK
ncbi:hypothetical protein ACIQXI_08020 [Lysinibacillus sp. NPDC097195]|uniref:hypothetical protein n=1 Tax=Lysinibacillus sp. NPDC097195 TaxID=3364141 RepID=UPI0038241C8A